MLACRTLPRNSKAWSSLWKNTTSSRSQFFRLGCPKRQFHQPPTTFASRLVLRRDGSPRSKLKTLALVTAVSGGLYSFYQIMLAIEELDTANYLLASLVHIQRVDYEFDGVDLSKPEESLNYFCALCGSFGDVPQQMVDKFFEDVSQLEGVDSSKVINQACQDVHDVLLHSKGEEPLHTATVVVRLLDQAMLELVDMVESVHGNEEERVERSQRIKEHMSKDVKNAENAEGADYESVG